MEKDIPNRSRSIYRLNALQWAALMGNSAQVRDLLLLGKDVDEVGQIIICFLELEHAHQKM
jgi:ankyrin repeat protein